MSSCYFIEVRYIFYPAIKCNSPPTITDGSTDCAASTAFGGTCTASCNSGFHMTGTATLTCQDSNSDGSGDFSTAPTCAGILLMYFYVALWFSSTYELNNLGNTICEIWDTKG